MKKQLLFLTFLLLFNLIAKAPVIYPVYNTSDLEAALYSAYPNSNPNLMPGDIIQIKSDLDVSGMDLPISCNTLSNETINIIFLLHHNTVDQFYGTTN